MTTCQLGSVIVFLVFIGTCMSDVLETDGWKVILCAFPAYGGLSLLPSTDKLSFSSLLGNVALVLCLGSTIAYGFSQQPVFRAPDDYKLGFDAGGLGVFFGLTVFGFSAHCEVVSIVQSLPDRHGVMNINSEGSGSGGGSRRRMGDLRKVYREGVLSWTFAAITILYVAFAVCCYCFFGGEGKPKLSGIVFLAMNTPDEPFCTLVKVVKCAMSVALLLQIPICLFPTWTILERPFFHQPGGSSSAAAGGAAGAVGSGAGAGKNGEGGGSGHGGHGGGGGSRGGGSGFSPISASNAGDLSNLAHGGWGDPNNPIDIDSPPIRVRHAVKGSGGGGSGLANGDDDAESWLVEGSLTGWTLPSCCDDGDMEGGEGGGGGGGSTAGEGRGGAGARHGVCRTILKGVFRLFVVAVLAGIA